MRKFLCGTPKTFCSGSDTMTNAGLGGSQKAHSSSVEAFKCFKKYKIQQEGYVEIGSRALRAPDGSGVLVLTKQSRFGSEMRRGKNTDGKGRRFQPKGRTSSGTFIS